MRLAPHRNDGFTLVELALVIVIIGLVVGGVLVGQDMIKQAEIKAVARQIEQFDSGGATFRTKYYNIAGDISATRAAQYGLTSRSGAIGQGDGNGRIENAGTATAGLGGETALYWRDLWDGRMIGLEYNMATDAIVDSSGWSSPATNELKLYMPEAKVRPSVFYHIYGANGATYYHMGIFGSGAADGTVTWTNGLTPFEAMGIDAKLDDGLPNAGLVMAVTPTGAMDTGAAPANGVCVNNTSAALEYNNGNDEMRAAIACQLRIRAQF
jgi:prepilin-type N-terminal cleavage/methylation domain-containing protein